MDLSPKSRKRGMRNTNTKGDGKRAKKEVVDDKVDMISDLPEQVLHQILSLLHPKDAARTCVLSRRWVHAWKSYQILDFDLRSCDMKKKKLDSYKLMMNRFLEYRKEQKLDIYKFRLRFIATSKVVCIAEHWLSSVIQRNVRELEIQARGSNAFNFCLPISVFQASSITSLNLYGCSLPTSVDDVDLPQLQKLSLKRTDVNLRFLSSMFTNCPKIDELRLIGCTGLKHLTIINSNRLFKRLDVHKCYGITHIVVENPHLESFWFFQEKSKHCKINLTECRALRDLVLEYPKMEDAMFQDMILELHQLKKLVLSRCSALKTIQVSGDKLRKLVITRCWKLADAQVDAPNLVSLEYNGQSMPFSFTALPHLKKASLRFQPFLKAKADWKLTEANRLKTFVGHLSGLKLMTSTTQVKDVHIYEDISMLSNRMGKIKKSHSVKLSACFRDLLTEALTKWPYPSKISVISRNNSGFPKDILKELNKGKGDPKCCAYFKNKCWRHYLKSIGSEKWFSESSGSSASPAVSGRQVTVLELDWNTNRHGGRKVIQRKSN